MRRLVEWLCCDVCPPGLDFVPKEQWPGAIRPSDDRGDGHDILDDLVLPLESTIVAAWMNYQETRYDQQTGAVLGPKSFSGVNNYRNAIQWFYKHKGIEMPPEQNEGLSDACQGYKKRTAKYKQEGKLKMHEGKYGVKFSEYRTMCETVWCADSKFGLNAWSLLFLNFCWNLMARSGMVADIILAAITMEGDAIGIEFAMHKGDQDGERKFKRHVYANPTDPLICPFLALAVYVFGTSGFGQSLDGAAAMLFGKSGGEGRFTEFLRVLLKEVGDQLGTMGLDASDIGTHSFRKGTVTREA